jgi:uncharacterized protein YaiL (DUF2058 family)
MSGSLKEELLKLGLGRKVKPVEPERRKRTERGERNAKAERAAPPARPAPAASQPKQPSAREARELERERARRNARLLEVVDANKVENTDGEIKHYYSTGRKIKYTYVSEAQQTALLAGELVIVIVQGKGRLVTSSLLPKLREIDPALRVVDPHAATSASDEEDPDHQVPDDLRW